MAKVLNIAGRTFNKLTVHSISEERIGKYKRVAWLCKCDCGKTVIIAGDSLLSGKTKSCGCLRSELSKQRRTTHNFSSTPEYKVFTGIKTRCFNVRELNYKDYGGRGITVCDRWLEKASKGFLNFLEDMGERPSDKHSIERINVNGNYEPSNCRWATKSEQVFNQRIRSTNTSGRTGVFLNRKGSWQAYIYIEYKKIKLGTFTEFEDAVKAREVAELKYYGVVRNE